MKPKPILAIDTSCDDTSASVVQGRRILSSIVSSQDNFHREYGGVVPSIARECHQKVISFAIDKALKKARVKEEQLAAIAVTQGPGLAIALEIGITKAQQLSQTLKIPLIPVNHLEAHLLSPFLQRSTGTPRLDISQTLPALGLVISGGHTDLVFVEKIKKYRLLGSTMDDAAGECIDKVARMLGLGYPGGKAVETIARRNQKKEQAQTKAASESEKSHNTSRKNTSSDPIFEEAAQKLRNTVPLQRHDTLDFSFSGVKTAFMYAIQKVENNHNLTRTEVTELAKILQNVVFDHIVSRWVKSKQLLHQQGITVTCGLAGGGVSSNLSLRKKLRKHLKTHFPYKKELCTDNAAMIGLVGQINLEHNLFLSPKVAKQLDRKPVMRY